ncbi:MAG: hypothetical protein JW909_12290 [Planctomycetes bacterium]|nr:hypothetical protein [Planctomycetota bacterium]
MATKKNDSAGQQELQDPEKAKGYIELAKITQTGFDNRRLAEWKIKLAFWGGLAILYYVVDQRSTVFEAAVPWWLLLTGLFVVFAIFCVFELAFQRANMTDKNWKHYFMEMAEFTEAKRHKRPEKGHVPVFEPFTTPWMWAYVLFTLLLITLLLVYTYRILPTIRPGGMYWWAVVVSAVLIAFAYWIGYVRGQKAGRAKKDKDG